MNALTVPSELTSTECANSFTFVHKAIPYLCNSRDYLLFYYLLLNVNYEPWLRLCQLWTFVVCFSGLTLRRYQRVECSESWDRITRYSPSLITAGRAKHILWIFPFRGFSYVNHFFSAPTKCTLCIWYIYFWPNLSYMFRCVMQFWASIRSSSCVWCITHWNK
jgi:hypothetical protein